MKKLALALALCAAGPAIADIAVRFDEGAPKDRFTFTNDGACDLPSMAMVLDLSTAPAGLIFDVTASGAGVEVFQPFELVEGAQALRSTPRVADGDQSITLDLTGLAPSQSVAFTIDIDDTGGGREITVSGSEIAGAAVRASWDGETATAAFDATAQARIEVTTCLS